MADLEILKNVIKNAQTQNYQEHHIDEHFDQIVDCIEREKPDEAAQLIETVFAKGIPDIRLIVYYFYAHFAENGIKSFIQTFPLIMELANDHWEVLSPKNKIEKHFQTALNWFFSQILLKIKFYEKMQHSGKVHPVWEKKFIDISIEEILNISDVSQTFKQFFLDKWPKAAAKDRVLNLVSKVEEIKSIISKNETKSVAPSSNSEVIVVEEDKETLSIMGSRDPSLDKNDDFEINPPHDAASDVFQEILSEPLSGLKENGLFSVADREELKKLIIGARENFDLLLKKINIFEAMIAKNDYLKAGIIAADIEQIIENFDPLEFFPKLFSNYYSLFATHAAALSEQFEIRDSLQVKALEKLYRANLEMFIDW